MRSGCQMSIVSPNSHRPCLQQHIPTLATYLPVRPSLVDGYPGRHTQAQMMILALRFIRGPFTLSEVNGSTRLASTTTCHSVSLPFNGRLQDILTGKAKHRFNLVTRRLAIVQLLRLEYQEFVSAGCITQTVHSSYYVSDLSYMLTSQRFRHSAYISIRIQCPLIQVHWCQSSSAHCRRPLCAKRN